jgi:hypothetical protein
MELNYLSEFGINNNGQACTIHIPSTTRYKKMKKQAVVRHDTSTTLKLFTAGNNNKTNDSIMSTPPKLACL